MTFASDEAVREHGLRMEFRAVLALLDVNRAGIK